MAPQPHGRKSGVVNYTREETLHMLEALKSVLPLGPDDWALVVDRHSVMYPGRDRISITFFIARLFLLVIHSVRQK